MIAASRLNGQRGQLILHDDPQPWKPGKYPGLPVEPAALVRGPAIKNNVSGRMSLSSGRNRGFYHMFYRADHACLTFPEMFRPITDPGCLRRWTDRDSKISPHACIRGTQMRVSRCMCRSRQATRRKAALHFRLTGESLSIRRDVSSCSCITTQSPVITCSPWSTTASSRLLSWLLLLHNHSARARRSSPS